MVVFDILKASILYLIAESIIFFNSSSLKSGAIFNHICNFFSELSSIFFLSSLTDFNSFINCELVCKSLSPGVLG